MKNVLYLIGLLAIWFIGFNQGMNSTVTAQSERFGLGLTEVSEFIVMKQDTIVNEGIDSATGTWQISGTGVGHFKYLMLDLVQLEDLPETDGVFAILDEPVRIAYMIDGVHYSSLVPEDELYLRHDFICDMVYRANGQWHYGYTANLFN